MKIHEIGSYAYRQYVIETDEGLVVVDTGYRGTFKSFRRRFLKRFRFEDVKYIFLSHHHLDHAGNLGELINVTDAKVILHEKAAEYLAAGTAYLGAGYRSLPAKIATAVVKNFTCPPVVIPNGRAIIINDDTRRVGEQGEFQILTLPGHSIDNIGLYIRDAGILFCGDAAMNIPVVNHNRTVIWIDDVKEFARSWEKIAALGDNTVYPIHGGTFPSSDLSEYMNFLERLADKA